ncbi:MAG: LysE family transporter [Actinomycetota bacterium]|nr:LysE family transporter [Actinomycetota bacterium]MDD5665993.1 LysE family transporter [Actinomycetota bacterium]
MSLVSIFFISMGVGLSGAVMPGPLLTVSINESYRKGFIAAPLLVAGHAVLEGALIVLLVLGLDRVVGNDIFFGVVGVAGGAFLFWMGLGMALDVRDGRLHIDLQTRGGTHIGPFVAGLTTSVSNPYWFLWWATFGLSWLLRSMDRGVAGVLAFFTGHILADLLWYLLVAFLVVTGKRFISNRAYKYVILGCGTFLLILGARFVGDGLFHLL